jgi:head-tail adaptor
MVASIPAGKKKHRVRLMRELDQMDGGRAVPTPTEIARFQAWIEPLAGRELGQIRQTLPEVTHRVRATWFRGVNQGTDYLLHNERRFAIVEAKNVDEDNTVLDMLCVEQTGGG